VAVSAAPGAEPISSAAIEACLRRAVPPVIGRIADARLLLDVRTVQDDQLPALARAFEETTS
jgi:hypothetical protein